MAKTDLKLYSTAQGSEKKITTSLPYINPEATSTTLKEFAVKLNNLTTNTYGETDRVQTINVDTEEVPVTPTDIEQYELTAVEFDQSKLTTDHTAIVAKLNTSLGGIAGTASTYLKVAITGATAGTYGVYISGTGNIHLITSSNFVLTTGTITINARFVRDGYAVKSATIEIPLTES